MTLVAGVDSSTQSCKVVVRDLETGAVVRSGRAPHPEGTEVDPEAWWHAMLEALDDAGGIEDVAAISIGGQQHGMVVLDAVGRVIRDALLWNDTRSAGAALDLIAEVGAEQLAERTGLVPVASFTITKVRWLRDSEPDNAARVAAVALPHDWLTWRLRGYGPQGGSELGADLGALTTDRSDASGTGYWNPSTGDYDHELFALALGHDAILPRVLAPGDVVDTEAAGYTNQNVVIAVGSGDNAAAGLGLGAREGDVVISIGTSGTVFAVTDSVVRDSTGTVAGFADASGAFLPLIATLNAARVLDAFTRVLNVSHDELGNLALEAAPGAAGAVLVPYFEGERTPNLPDATAQLTGLTLASTTRSNLARAAIEGMLCGLADGLEAIRAQGVKADRALLIGGAAQNPAVARIAAEVLGIPVSVPTPGEYVAMGAAVQAGWSLTGARPTWTVDTMEVEGVESQPGIHQQYRAAQTAAHGVA